jgi:hypothetical protein
MAMIFVFICLFVVLLTAVFVATIPLTFLWDIKRISIYSVVSIVGIILFVPQLDFSDYVPIDYTTKMMILPGTATLTDA